MTRVKSVLAPYVRDVVAFAILAVSIATVMTVAVINRDVQQASLYQSVTQRVDTRL